MVDSSPLPKCVVEHSTLNHIAIVKDVVEAHYKNRALTDEHMLKYTEEEWLATETRYKILLKVDVHANVPHSFIP
jgi:hypothetical protein